MSSCTTVVRMTAEGITDGDDQSTGHMSWTISYLKVVGINEENDLISL